jgi:hypothetical protein
MLCFFFNFLGRSEAGSLGTPATSGPIVPVPDDDEYGAFCEMRISNGN